MSVFERVKILKTVAEDSVKARVGKDNQNQELQMMISQNSSENIKFKRYAPVMDQIVSQKINTIYHTRNQCLSLFFT